VVYGLSREGGGGGNCRNFILQRHWGVARDLEELKKKIEPYGVSLTIVVLVDYVTVGLRKTGVKRTMEHQLVEGQLSCSGKSRRGVEEGSL